MDEKSHVSLEQHVCLVCGVGFDTGAILLDRRLRASMKRHTTTGWDLCAAHRKLFDEGFVALIECDPQRSGAPAGKARLKPQQAWRTGRLVHLKREAFARVFDVPLAADQCCVFVEPGVIEQLQPIAAPRGTLLVGGVDASRVRAAAQRRGHQWPADSKRWPMGWKGWRRRS